MKKTIFALSLLLLAGTVMATGTVTITIVPDGTNPCLASVNYTSDANVRAFALNVVLTGANVSDVNNYKTDGESETGSKGYGIYLDQETGIDINDQGIVQIYGSPVASPNSPGASGSGIGTTKVVLGMGALYQDGNQPSHSGTLCKILASGACTASITAETTYRGGVVMEDGTAPTTLTLTGATNVSLCAAPECKSSGASDYAQWGLVGKPNCWCGSYYPRQCHGDADNHAEGKLNYWVYLNDVSVVLAAWGKAWTAMSTVTGGTYSTPGICGDIDHLPEGKLNYRVYLNDVTIILANWGTNATPPNCP